MHSLLYNKSKKWRIINDAFGKKKAWNLYIIIFPPTSDVDPPTEGPDNLVDIEPKGDVVRAGDTASLSWYETVNFRFLIF